MPPIQQELPDAPQSFHVVRWMQDASCNQLTFEEVPTTASIAVDGSESPLCPDRDPPSSQLAWSSL